MGEQASARSLLVLVLGEYVLPTGGSIRTRQAVTGLGRLAISEPAVRQALRRLANEGWLDPATRGTWFVGEPARRLLSEGKRRFGRASRAPASWDGRWLLVRTTVPESQRQLRHLLRSALAFQGFGSLGQGWWLSADLGAEDSARAVLERLGVAARSFVATTGDIGGDAQQLVDEAWDLAEAGARYDKLLAEYRTAHPDADDEVFAVYTRLVDQWRRALAVDPQLPPELLPRDWPGQEARDLLNDRYSRWHQTASSWWEQL